MDIEALVKLAEAGALPVMLFLLWNVWVELKNANKFTQEMLLKLFELNLEAKEERHQIRRSLKLTDSTTQIPIHKS